MTLNTEMSTSEIVLEGLGFIWNPGAEALKVQQDLNVRSLGELAAAAGRAGYEICYVDLPPKVSGFAVVIAGRPHIVINRAKSRPHQQYTIAHELGHHVLHVNPTQDPNQPGLPIKNFAEFQAHMFAASLIFWTMNDKQREDVLKQNPESLIFPALAIFMSFAVILTPLLVHLWSRLFPGLRSGSAESE